MVRIRTVWYWKRYMRKSRYRYNRYLLYLPKSIGDVVDTKVEYVARNFWPSYSLAAQGAREFLFAPRRSGKGQSEERCKQGWGIYRFFDRRLKNLQTGGMQSKYITYSGDGAESHLIDVGFSPKIIMLGGLSVPDLPQPNSNMPKLPLGQTYLIISYDLTTDICNILVGTSYYAEIYSIMPQTIAGLINGTQVDVGILAAISGFEWLNSNGLSFFLQAFG